MTLTITFTDGERTVWSAETMGYLTEDQWVDVISNGVTIASINREVIRKVEWAEA